MNIRHKLAEMNVVLGDTITKMVESKGLLPNAANNLKDWLEGGFLSEASLDSLRSLIESGNTEELNNRFYTNIAFGTGGLRGRTIGMTATSSEKGYEGPSRPGVGSNMLNEYTVAKATLGLYRYAQKVENCESPKLIIAHDVRYFSRFFCELSASIWTQCGGKAYIFDGPRSTPELSFAVRELGATCGVVITASHNPPQDNGYKAYFSDGAQLVPPDDTGVIEQVEAITLSELKDYLEIDLSEVQTLGKEIDDDYVHAIVDTVIDPEALKGTDLKVVFTPIHGTGAISTLPAMEQLGLEPILVEEQMIQDPEFPTVRSPNPENAEALDMAIQLSLKENADILMGTDPDCDRMGVGVKNPDGGLTLITGNQIGAMLADYRISSLKEMGWIPNEGTQSAALIKTFVTSPLQDAIGKAHGIKVINTLTGFKWIGEKLRIYEEQLKESYEAETGKLLDYDALGQEERASILQKYSTFCIFGGEESYGYLPTDAVRDKDGNAASIIFCELAASLKKEGRTILEYLDELYLRHGYFLETLGQIVYEGASGAVKIARILGSYRSDPPIEFLASKVNRFTDFGRETVTDPDGKEIPKQDLYFVELEDGYRYAVRGSGTEPKIKFYLFGNDVVEDATRLEETKAKTRDRLEALKAAILDDANVRAGG